MKTLPYKGPWYVDRSMIEADVLVVFASEGEVARLPEVDERTPANSALIATAPELLDLALSVRDDARVPDSLRMRARAIVARSKEGV